MLDTLALGAIRQYQRHLSPRKGHACARRVHTGRASCSAFLARAIRRFGLWRALRLVPARARACRASFDALQATEPAPGTAPPATNEPCPLWSTRGGRHCTAGLAIDACCWPVTKS